MKTVTVTHQNAINYGAVLQAYALQQQLIKLCVDDEILDLERTHQIFNEVKFNKHLPGNIYSSILNLVYIVQTKKKIKRIKEFVKNNINTTRHYKAIEEVIQNPPVADAYITGSDQTFNTFSGVKYHNFLKFGGKGIKRMSYASSMGISAVKDEYLDEFISAIKAYDFLSVREESTAAYISELCAVPCATNIDPSLLLTKEEWGKLASGSTLNRKIGHRKYILVYLLLNNPLLDAAAKKIKKETGLEVIVITSNAMCSVHGDIIVRDAGPAEFLELFKNAEYVLTTSFHGACFSILFQKTFFSFIRNVGETRITNLLNIMHLSERIITDLSQIRLDSISYDVPNEILQKKRVEAIEYLSKALGI